MDEPTSPSGTVTTRPCRAHLLEVGLPPDDDDDTADVALAEGEGAHLIAGLDASRSVDEVFDVLQTRLGRGKFSEVRLGLNKRTRERVAIKVLCKAGSSAARIETEVSVLRACRQLGNPNLIQLHDTFESPTEIHLVFELLPGGTLLELLQRRGGTGLPENIARTLVKQVLSGLRALHSIKVVHRDLKLDNVLLDANGKARIIDFGFAKRCDDASPTRFASSPVGTPGFVAPEVFGGGGYDFAVDMWALGIVAFVLIYAVPPFTERSPPEFHRLQQGAAASPKGGAAVASSPLARSAAAAPAPDRGEARSSGDDSSCTDGSPPMSFPIHGAKQRSPLAPAPAGGGGAGDGGGASGGGGGAGSSGGADGASGGGGGTAVHAPPRDPAAARLSSDSPASPYSSGPDSPFSPACHGRSPLVPKASRLIARMRRGWSFPTQTDTSESAKAFITGLLQMDPLIRLSSLQATAHPWIHGQSASSSGYVRRPGTAANAFLPTSSPGGDASDHPGAPRRVRSGRKLGADRQSTIARPTCRACDGAMSERRAAHRPAGHLDGYDVDSEGEGAAFSAGSADGARRGAGDEAGGVGADELLRPPASIAPHGAGRRRPSNLARAAYSAPLDAPPDGPADAPADAATSISPTLEPSARADGHSGRFSSDDSLPPDSPAPLSLLPASSRAGPKRGSIVPLSDSECDSDGSPNDSFSFRSRRPWTHSSDVIPRAAIDGALASEVGQAHLSSPHVLDSPSRPPAVRRRSAEI